MAFDAGPRSQPPSEPAAPRHELTWSDRLDAVLRAVVILPLAALYLFWVAGILKDFALVAWQRLTEAASHFQLLQ
jgi:hypothetical protein